MTATFRITCPHCGEPTRAPLENFFRWWPKEDAKSLQEEKDNEASLVEAACASYCPECEAPISLIIEGKQSLLRELMSDDTDESIISYYQNDLSLKRHYPDSSSPLSWQGVPSTISSAFEEVLQGVKQGRNSAIILSTCRSILEAALREIEGKSGSTQKKLSLAERIDNLHAAGAITSDIANWSHQIRLDGNRSTHELVGDPVAADSYVSFLKIFLEISLELPTRIKLMKRPPSTNPAPAHAAGKPPPKP